MVLYKRNHSGKPIFWEITDLGNAVKVRYGLVGTSGHVETYTTNRLVSDEIKSAIAAKRKSGYKSLEDIYDNAPKHIDNELNLNNYLNLYLPKDNTDDNGNFIPMLCKTLEDNKPFVKGSYFGQWKINGERCIITATKSVDLFNPVKLHYRSRKGIDWTDKLTFMDEYLLEIIPDSLIEQMVEEDVALDGEMYIPGYNINDINSIIKNVDRPEHYLLQFWCYDICIDDMSAVARQGILESAFNKHIAKISTKEDHLNNKERFLLLPNQDVNNIKHAITVRDSYIDLGFEGLVIREDNANYQFGGKRNNSMLKFKRIEDGKFTIVDIVPEGVKRSNLPKFICKNDINDELFECTYNAPQTEQELILIKKESYLHGRYVALVEYRERSGIKQVPFHAKIVKLIKQ